MDKKEKRKAYMKKYRQRPEVKEKTRKYNQKTEVRKRKAEYQLKPSSKKKARERYQNPEVKKRKIKYQRKPEIIKRRKEYMQEYGQRPEVINRIAKYKKKPKVKVMEIRNRLKKKYNLSLEDYNNIFKKQGFKCAICGKKETKRRISVDHCHKTDKVRGLLCQLCNTSLGGFKDDVNLLQEAIKYLIKSR